MRLPKTPLMPVPADCCPHASGRAGGFAGCVAYTPVVVRPPRVDVPGLDLGPHVPMPVLTCAHLTAGSIEDGRFYPCCRLGVPAARRLASA
jgi:hypothetical protein